MNIIEIYKQSCLKVLGNITVVKNNRFGFLINCPVKFLCSILILAGVLVFLGIFLAILAVYLACVVSCLAVIFCGFIFLIVLFVIPITTSTSNIDSLSSLDFFKMETSSSSKIQIFDSNSCSSHLYGVCIEKICSYSFLYDHNFNCDYYIKISEPVLFNKFVINCNTDDICNVTINSKNFKSNQLFIYGFDIQVHANSIQTGNFFFDSYKGSLKVKELIFDKATVNSSVGDIIIQSKDSVQLTTYTQNKYVCVTCVQGWKDNINQISNLADVFQEKDPDKEECFIVYSYKSRNQDLMVQLGIHSTLEQQGLYKYSNQDEIRCILMDKVILMNNTNNPSTVPNLKQIIAGNFEGNIYINVVSSQQKINPQLINSEYKNQNVQLRRESYSSLNSTVRTTIDSGNSNEIIYLDFRETEDYVENFVYMMIFSPIYLHFSSKWLSSLSFSSLSSKEQSLKLSLNPGICPYIFSYSMFENQDQQQQQVDSRESILSNLIDQFIENEGLDVYLVSPWKDYNSFTLRDESTYLPIKNIKSNVMIIVSTELICIATLLIGLFLMIQILLNKLRIFVDADGQKDKEKIIFFLFQNQQKLNDIVDQLQEQKSCSPEDSPLIQKSNSSAESNEEEGRLKETEKKKKHNFLNQIYPEKVLDGQEDEILLKENNKIKLQCEFQINDYLSRGQFQTLLTQGFIWLLSRYSTSAQIFYRQFFKDKYSKDRLKKSKVQIKVSELKEYFQKFCYLYNLKEESLSNYESPSIDERQFNFVYDQYIVFKKFDENQLKNNQTIVELSLPQKQQIQDFIKQYGNFKNEMSLSEFYFIMSNSNKLSARENRIIKEKKQVNVIENENKNEIELISLDKNSNQEMNQDNQNLEKQDQNQQEFKKENQTNLINLINGCQPDELQYPISEKEIKIRRLSFFEFDESNQNQENNENEQKDQAVNKQSNQFDFYIYATKEKVLALSYFRDNQSSFYTIINQNFLYFIDHQFSSFLQNNSNNNTIIAKLSPLNYLVPPKKFLNCIAQQCLNQDQILYFYLHQKAQNLQRGIRFAVSIFQSIINSNSKDKKSSKGSLKVLIAIIRFQSIFLLYLASPFLSCLITIAFIVIYMRQSNKFKIENYNGETNSVTASDVFNFNYVGISLLMYLCLLFILYFYKNLFNRSLTLSDNSKNVYLGQFKLIKNYKDLKNQTYLRVSGLSIFHNLIYRIVTFLLLIIQFIYLIVAILVQIVGTILFPRVQLPTLIFFGVLIGVVINSIVEFKNVYEQGYEKLKTGFENQLIQNWKKSQKSKRRKKNQENKNEHIIPSKAQIQGSRIFKQKAQKASNLTGLKDLSAYQESRFEEMFKSIEGCNDMELSEEEFKAFLNSIKMNLNQVQLDQVYAHLYSQKVDSYVNVWKMDKNMSINEFEQAIDYIILKKVNFTLTMLDMSYASLYLSIFKTIFQSVIIAWMIYSVYVGLSSSDSSFDFSTNSIVSLGGVLGIVFSKEDKGKVFQDENLIQSSIEKTEKEFHDED